MPKLAVVLLSALTVLVWPSIAATEMHSQRTVYLDLTYDPSVAKAVALEIESVLREAASAQHDWIPVTPAAELTFTLGTRHPTREEMLHQTRESGARYGSFIQISRQRAQFGLAWLAAQVWTVDAGPGEFVTITSAAWTPGDSSGQSNHLRLLLDRILPSMGDLSCFYEFIDIDTRHDRHGAVTRAEASVRVLTNHNERIADAPVKAHWFINGRRAVTFDMATDTAGVARVEYTPAEDDPPIGTILLRVDSLDCFGAPYDPQWPQREVDQAVALLENARADLDELGDYESALRKAQEFLALEEGDLSWYSVLMNPQNAPNRRTQAEFIMRRAREEQRRADDMRSKQTTRGERWQYSFWGGLDIPSPTEGDIIVSASDGSGSEATISANPTRVFGTEFDVGYRLHDVLWVTSGLSYAGGKVRWRYEGNTLSRQVSRFSLYTGLRAYSSATKSTSLFGDVSVRLTRRSANNPGPWYLVNNRIVGADPGAQLHYPIEKDTGSFYPALEFGGGLSLLRGDFTPTRTSIGVYNRIERLPDGRSTWGIYARAGVALLR